MLQDFCGRFLARTPPKKRVCKIRFFLHCIQDSPTSSFHLQKISLFPPCCKGRLSIFDLCWGDFTTSPSYYIGHLFEIFNHPPGSVEGKTFSTTYRNCCPLSSAGSLITITGGPYSIGQGNRQSRRHRARAPQDFA